MIVGTPRNTSAYDDREERIGRERAARELADDRDDERPDQHEHLGHDEQLDVPPEPVDAVRSGCVQIRSQLNSTARTRAVVAPARKNAPNATISGDEPEPEHVEQVVARRPRRRCAASRIWPSSASRAGAAGCGRWRGRRTPGRRAPRCRARSRWPSAICGPGAPISSDWSNVRSPAHVSSGDGDRGDLPRSTARRCRA